MTSLIEPEFKKSGKKKLRARIAELEEVVYCYEWATRQALARMRADATARHPFQASEQMQRAREIGAEITDRRERRA